MDDEAKVGDHYPPRDRVGKIVPHRLGTFTWLKVIPGVFRLFDKSVPDEFWNRDVTEDDRETAIVACPCGEEPIVPFGNFAVCSGVKCGRVYLNAGAKVKVAQFDPAELAGEAPVTPVAD